LTTGKDNKQLTKVIEKESKIEKAALTVAIKELTELQGLQKAAVRVSESHALGRDAIMLIDV
jgi:hypothetical protein